MALSSAYGSIFTAKDESSSLAVMATVPVGRNTARTGPTSTSWWRCSMIIVPRGS